MGISPFEIARSYTKFILLLICTSYNNLPLKVDLKIQGAFPFISRILFFVGILSNSNIISQHELKNARKSHAIIEPFL